jgi:hypothetical protein
LKKIKPSYPRRREMLSTPFVPLSDEEFRGFVAGGQAIPCQQGSALFVSKWRDGPGLDPTLFLKAMRAQGSTIEVRHYRQDVNIRVVPRKTEVPQKARTAKPAPKGPG